MSKIFDKNIKELEKLNSIYSDKILTETYEDCEFTVKSQSIEDKKVWYLEYANKIMQLESLYDNNLVNNLWVNSVLSELKYNTKIFVYGISNVEFIRKIISRTGEENHIVLYEPNFSIIKVLMEQIDFTDIFKNKRCTLIMGNCLDDSIRNTYERYISYTDCFNKIHITGMNYNMIFEEDYNSYTKGLEMALSTVTSNFGYYSNSGKYSNKNVFRNLRYIFDSKSIESLNKLIDKNVPAIIVAAGPSLNKNIKYLKDAKGRAIIIAIDAAMRALAREGVTPDLCITVDFNKELGHFDEGDSNEIPMICSLISTASFVENNKAIKLFYREDTPYINEFFDKNDIKIQSLPTGGTVANNALSIAVHMGCKNIIMVGQDLAYTNNQTHAAGTVKGDTLTADSVKNIAYVEDLHGNKLQTCGEFVLYKQWIEETVATRKDIHFVNATEGGAGIKGCEHITLMEAIDKYCRTEINIADLLKRTDGFLNEEQKQSFIEYMCEIPDVIKKVEKEALSGVECYEKMLKMIARNEYTGSDFNKLYRKTKRINKKIDEDKISPMIFNEIQHEMNETMKTIFSSEEDDVKSELTVVCTQGKESFSRIAKAAKELREYVGEELLKYKENSL